MRHLISIRSVATILFIYFGTTGALIAQSLTGNYQANGRNPDGTAYSGTVQIQEKGSSIAMAWVIGGKTFTGAGQREGRVVTVEWGQSDPVIYVVNGDGTLYGTWARGRALEHLQPIDY